MTRWSPLLAALLASCNVESTTTPSGGVDTETPVAGCPAGIAVTLSDYSSTQIALSSLDGTTLSESFLSSASTKTDGLAFALSGDVTLPSSPPLSGRVVVIDRFGTNVITWADPRTALVLAQLAIGTGFESNPVDYLELDTERALVTRYGENTSPGREPHDRGGDVLLLDTRSFQILDSIELPRHEGLPPRPSAMTRVGDRVLIALGRSALDFKTTGDAELVSLDATSLELQSTLTLPGLKACGRPVPSPDKTRLALACTGEIDVDGNAKDLSQSALLLLDPSVDPPREIQRFRALDLGSGALQSEVAFAAENLVLLKTQTPLGGATNNRWLALNLASGELSTIIQAAPDSRGKGRGIVYGGMFCAPGCSTICLVADGAEKTLERVRVQADSFELLTPVRVEQAVGLPPRDLAPR
jgi:hypothetical protein